MITKIKRGRLYNEIQILHLKIRNSANFSYEEKFFKKWFRMKKWYRFMRSYPFLLPFVKADAMVKNGCVPRAIAHLAGRDFHEIQKELDIRARDHFAVSDSCRRIGGHGRYGYVPEVYMPLFREIFPLSKNIYISGSCKWIYEEYGSCLIRQKAHVFAIKNGHVYDICNLQYTNTGRPRIMQKISTLE